MNCELKSFQQQLLCRAETVRYPQIPACIYVQWLMSDQPILRLVWFLLVCFHVIFWVSSTVEVNKVNVISCFAL